MLLFVQIILYFGDVMRFIMVLLTLYSLLSAQFLEPEEAFKVGFEKKQKDIELSIELADEIYLYADQIKVFKNVGTKQEEITAKLTMPEPIEYEEFITYFNKLTLSVPNTLVKDADSITLSYQGCSKAGLCYPPTKKEFVLVEQKPQTQPSQTSSIAQTMQESSFIWVLLTFFGFGLLLSLTPCVFPMVPILSSIIVSHSSSDEKMSAKKGFVLSLVYVLSMSLAYTIAGVIAGVFGANLQAALQNPIVLVAFSAIFVALAFSMFGYYKLQLPQSVQNAINKKTDGKKGVQGVAVMGFLSALIVGPCVAPPLAGALVYIGQTGDALLGGAALFFMSIGMGLPLLALGAGAGKFMPKPGGWMDAVSKAFGVVMLGVAIWMLERVLPSVITMVLWAALFLGSAIYLKAHHFKKPSLKKIFGIFLGVYGILIAVGAFSGATSPLNPLKPFLSKQMLSLEFKEVKSLKELHEEVSSTDKIVMIDFTASWCVNCKELKEVTFVNPLVYEKLQNYHLLKVDVTKNSAPDRKMMQYFNVFGPPALIFYKDGKKLDADIIGFINPQEFLEFLSKNIE